MSRTAKYCFVPTCKNSSFNSNKIFLTVPFNEATRKEWCVAVGRQKIPKHTSGNYYCCEDHFDLEEDCENWVRYKLIQQKLILRKDVVPHKNVRGEVVPKHVSQLSDSPKKRKMDNLQQVSQSYLKSISLDVPSTSAQISSTESSPEKISEPGSSQKSTICWSISNSSVASTLTSSRNQDSSSDESVVDYKDTYLQKLSVERTLLVIENNSRFYLGLPEDTYFIVKLLEDESKISYRNILVVLKKIRLNDSFYRIALDFGISVSAVSKIFTKDLPILARFFRSLIFWPQPDLIKQNLPIPFRARYWKVQSIIDCFEVQIEQPTNSLHQTLTWSEYKKCNTLKYLISATPDGVVNFVSTGFGGRATDSEIVKESGYIDILPQQCDVMADRGFKHIDSLLATKNCKLIRPPSIATGSKSSKEDVKLSKRIASLRIHIERVIRRLREFEMLKPHACVTLNMAWKLDYVVFIACGIINFQGPLIK